MDRWDWDEEFDDMKVGSVFVSEAQEVEEEVTARLRAAAAWLSQVVVDGSPVRVEAEVTFCPWSEAATAWRAQATAERPGHPEPARIDPVEVERALAGVGLHLESCGDEWTLRAEASSAGLSHEEARSLVEAVARRVAEQDW